MARRAVVVVVCNVKQKPKERTFQDRTKAAAFVAKLKGPLTIQVFGFLSGKPLFRTKLSRGAAATTLARRLGS
jgi:hypothetical protein